MLATAGVSAGEVASFSDFSWEGLETLLKKLPKMEVRLVFSAFFSSFFSSFSSFFSSFFSAASVAGATHIS